MHYSVTKDNETNLKDNGIFCFAKKFSITHFFMKALVSKSLIFRFVVFQQHLPTLWNDADGFLGSLEKNIHFHYKTAFETSQCK